MSSLSGKIKSLVSLFNFSVSCYHTSSMRLSFCLLLIFLSFVYCSVVNDTSSEETKPNKHDHTLSLAWSLHPLLGVIGTILNISVLVMFVSERQTFINIINLMIWSLLKSQLTQTNIDITGLTPSTG